MAETRSADVRLRRFRFVIHSRPAKGPVLWKRGGWVYTEAEALAQVQRDLLNVKQEAKA